LKLNYRNYLSNDKNKCHENGIDFSVNILDAMIHLKKSWDDVSQTTVKNCFHKAQFIKDSQSDVIVDIAQIEDYQDQLPSFDDDHIPVCAPEDQIVEDSSSDDEEEDKIAENSIRVINSETAMSHFQELKQFLLSNNADCMQVNDFKLMLYSAIDNSKIQTKITDFFSK
jgi:hypothetical protein